MNRLLLFLVAAISLGIISWAHAQDELKLPESEKTAIFTMDFSGGFRMAQPKGFVKNPYLQVFADGRVVNSPNSPQQKPIELQLDKEQLNDLLEELVNEYKFFEIDSDGIAAEIKATGQRIMIADAPTLKLSMELADRTNAISVYAASFAASQFPKIESLQRVAKLEKLGRRLVRIAKAGGYEQVETALTMVNEALKKKELQPMTIEQFVSCRTKEGTTTLSFNRKFYKPDGRWRDYINANFIINGDEESVEIKSNINEEAKPATKKPKLKSA